MKLIILDRDGVINIDREGEYILTPDDWHLIEGAAEAIAQFNARAMKVAVATNQSPIGRGWITEAQLEEIHAKMHQTLAEKNAHLDAVFFAPHHPDQATERRKPAPGMLREAMTQFEVTPDETVMVGDKESDIKAAQAAGCHAVWVRSGQALPEDVSVRYPDVPVYDSLYTFARDWEQACVS